MGTPLKGETSAVGLRPYFCTNCPLSFPTPEALGEHLPTHDVALIPQFSDPLERLAEETDLPESAYPRKCPLCPQVCKSGGGYGAHARFHQREQGKPPAPPKAPRIFRHIETARRELARMKAKLEPRLAKLARLEETIRAMEKAAQKELAG